MRYAKIRFALTLLLGLSLLGVLPALAAKGNGIVVEGNPVGTEGIGPLNPLVCNDPYCRQITDFLFPTLYAVDPQTGLLIGAAKDNNGLVLDTTAPTTATSIIKVRDDLIWNDGTPVTAYDVFYSYLAITSGHVNTSYIQLWSTVKAARVVNEHQIKFAFTTVNCSTLAHINFPIIPAHVFDPQFQKIVENAPAENDLEAWFERWLTIYPSYNFDQLNNHPFNLEPTVSSGKFQFAERLEGEEIRLKNADGELAFTYRNIPQGMDETQFFRSGNSNVLVNPPLEVRDDLLADSSLKITQMPGDTWNYIAMNIADPNLPRSAADGTGKALQQGHHPIFGDLRMRQALQKAIDVHQLINTSLLGYGLPLLSSRIPGSWAANDQLLATAYNPEEVQQLLRQAGWIDHNADGIRECDGCLYASQGYPLSFSLLVASGDGREIAATLIANQLRSLGIQVNVNVTDKDSLRNQIHNQQFDAYMDGQTQSYPTDADQTDLFTRIGDVLYVGGNDGSYTNPEIETLMNQALTLPGCESNARAEIYRNIQSILQNDQPYIWLYATKDMLVTHDIVGAAPYPNQPFWNIQDWIVTS